MGGRSKRYEINRYLWKQIVRIVIDIEANALNNPDKIWVIACRDIDTGDLHVFRNVHNDKGLFRAFSQDVTHWIGHNFLGYDYPVLHDILDISIDNIASISTDTLIVSKLVHYSRKDGHRLEAYGEEFGLPKGDNKGLDLFKRWSQELEDYCIRDVDICNKVYSHYSNIINDPDWHSSLLLEHQFQLIVNDLHKNGFGFDLLKAKELHQQVTKDLEKLDEEILTAFPPREVLLREFTPKATKFGTIHKGSVPRSLHEEIHRYQIGTTYRHTKTEPFNPSSHKQLIDVLSDAGWKPENKTATHIEAERNGDKEKLVNLGKYGWRIDETNLATLPPSAPPPARMLAKRILLEARRRTLVEWISLVGSDNRIHGKFYGIGAWTHRMAHQAPNTANIPREFKEDGSLKVLGREMRELWIAPEDRLLVGVDAEGIQLRIFAHYIDDKEFTKSLIEGKKDDKSDPHSLNQKILGDICRTRQAAKRFIYALLLGAGMGKLSQILDATRTDTEKALNRLLERYTGFARLKKNTIPKDARNGYFIGLDSRKVVIPGETYSQRRHLAMSGYLQNGEAIIIKRAAVEINKSITRQFPPGTWRFVNIVHDELQSECTNIRDIAQSIAKIKADAIRIAGEELKLKCPMAGSYWNDDHKDYTIGKNWYLTH
jgi:DNA polymerase-1